jgi:hypothetical protein
MNNLFMNIKSVKEPKITVSIVFMNNTGEVISGGLNEKK